MKIGAVIPAKRDIILNEGKKRKIICVSNIGDRPIQVGSHYHFFEVNKFLVFDRGEAFGYHLDIPSGTSVRIEPGEEKEVALTAIGGKKQVYGLNDLTCGEVSEEGKTKALKKAADKGMIMKGSTQ